MPGQHQEQHGESVDQRSYDRVGEHPPATRQGHPRFATGPPSQQRTAVDETVRDESRDRVASPRRDLGQRQPLGEPHTEQDTLEAVLLRREQLTPRGGRETGVESLGIGTWVLHVPPAHPTDMAVRTRADPPPVVTPPVGEVVTARGVR